MALSAVTYFLTCSTSPYGNYWIYNFEYNINWYPTRSSRLSILFSLIRITRNLRPTRTLYVFAVLFFLAWAFLTAQLFWICESQKGWKEKPIPQCTLGTVVAVCQIVCKSFIAWYCRYCVKSAPGFLIFYWNAHLLTPIFFFPYSGCDFR